MTSILPPLQHTIDSIAVPGILVDHRLIQDGDELALLPEERAAFAGSVLKGSGLGIAGMISVMRT